MTSQRRMLLRLSVFAALSLMPPGCRTWTRGEQKAAEAYNLGNTLRENDALDEAREAYRLALRFNPNMAAASFNLALILGEQERFAEALDILRKLRRRDSVNLEIIRAMAWTHRRAGEPEEALGLYTEALGVFEADQESLRAVAGILEDTGRPAEALEYRRALVRLDPSNVHRRDMARSLAADGRSAEALDEYRRLILEGDAGSDLLIEAAEAALESAFADEAAGYYERSAEGEGDKSEAWMSLARLRFIELGDYGGGLEALGAALEAGFDDEERLEKLISDSPPDIRPSIRERLERIEAPEEPAGEVTEPEAEAPEESAGGLTEPEAEAPDEPAEGLTEPEAEAPEEPALRKSLTRRQKPLGSRPRDSLNRKQKPLKSRP